MKKLLLLGSLLCGFVLISSGCQRKSADTVKNNSHRQSQVAVSQSSAASSSQPTTANSNTTFPTAKVRQAVQQTVGQLSGDTSVYIAPTSGTEAVSLRPQPQRSASSIKLFILTAAYANHLDLQATHTLTAAEQVGGTGVLQTMPAGTQLTYQEILTKMITDSDNTATNIIIDQLGGVTKVNQEIQALGATQTTLRRKMLDTQALANGKDNTTTAKDMGVLLTKLYNHQCLGATDDSAILSILAQTKNHEKLPAQLPAGTTVYNKTGEYPDYGVQNDAALIKNDKGAFVAVVLSQNGQQTQQISAMSQLGLKLYQVLLA